jgi:hypothetical protein
MQRIESDLTVRQDLIRNGFENAKRFADADAMASQYLTTLAEVMQGASSPLRELRHG